METYKEHKEIARAQRAARRRYLAALKALEDEHAAFKKGGHDRPLDDLPTQQPAVNGGAPPAAASSTDAKGSGGDSPRAAPPRPSGRRLLRIQVGGPALRRVVAVLGGLRPAALRCWTPLPLPCSCAQLQALSHGHTFEVLKDTLREDAQYSAWLARQLDIACAVVLLLGYILAVVLIYTLQCECGRGWVWADGCGVGAVAGRRSGGSAGCQTRCASPALRLAQRAILTCSSGNEAAAGSRLWGGGGRARRPPTALQHNPCIAAPAWGRFIDSACLHCPSTAVLVGFATFIPHMCYKSPRRWWWRRGASALGAHPLS